MWGAFVDELGRIAGHSLETTPKTQDCPDDRSRRWGGRPIDLNTRQSICYYSCRQGGGIGA